MDGKNVEMSGRKKRKGFECGMLEANTISTLILVKSAGSLGDGRCCHPSGYLQIALGLPPSPSPKIPSPIPPD
jgi:hypothetical protein